ncbi:PilZ domain-containing protein [Roseateles violae]|uniref:Cyclic diguanosine monophosphate-binding protein n=1 Tax=Roseateles violae TaxID=3058042 RepID=A0ABT8DWF5_9BURK|nr:PilZ domain-containing protein [Pelomonas sp. PFR6]MDN3922567.1 PilZ domain-containing protein [Pelomonas sp. PFR6]
MVHSHREPAIETDRRQFNRVAFATGAELITTQERLQAQVLDLSLKGALLQLPAGALVGAGTPCLLKLLLADQQTVISMAGELAHVEGERAGMLCRSIDIESITHLRRLVEINLGDHALLERDLKALIAG